MHNKRDRSAFKNQIDPPIPISILSPKPIVFDNTIQSKCTHRGRLTIWSVESGGEIDQKDQTATNKHAISMMT